MHYLATLRDKDVFPQSGYSAPNHYEKRVTVKAVVKNEIGQYGFVTNPIHGFYLLAGGGADSENIIQEIKRECLEEIGYEVEVVGEIGRIHEFRDRDAKEYETICFLVKTKKEMFVDLRTENEKKMGFQLCGLMAKQLRKF